MVRHRKYKKYNKNKNKNKNKNNKDNNKNKVKINKIPNYSLFNLTPSQVIF